MKEQIQNVADALASTPFHMLNFRTVPDGMPSGIAHFVKCKPLMPLIELHKAVEVAYRKLTGQDADQPLIVEEK